MFTTGWYKFFTDQNDAIAGFNQAFVNDVLVRTSSVRGIQTGCFGSYGSAYSNNPHGEFYFSLSAQTENVEQAIAYFNKHFTHIQIEIVAKALQYSVYETFRGYTLYTERGWKELPEETRKKAEARSEFRIYNQYLFRIHISPAYGPQTAYVLQIPIGFWVRMFCAYYGCLDNAKSPVKRNPIKSALVFSNKNPGANSGYISDYIVKEEVFMAMDDPERMTEYFEKGGRAQYLRSGNWSAFDYGNSIKPYSVYYVIEHAGNRGNVMNNW